MDSMDGTLSNYLDRFPTGFRDFVRIESNRKAFLARVRYEYKPLKVYRFVHCCKAVFERDFLNNIEESSVFTPKKIIKNDLDNYGVSVNESLEQMKMYMKFPNRQKHYYGIAVGEMNCIFGPASFDEDRPHHNYTAGNVAKNFMILVED